MSPTPSQPSTPLRSRSLSQHHPSTPSRLKHSHGPGSSSQDELDSPTFQTPASRLPPPLYPSNTDQRSNQPEDRPGRLSPNATQLRPRHWRNYSTHNCSQAEGETCEHGSLSPKIRPSSPRSINSTLDDVNSFGGRYARSQSIVGGPNTVLGDAIGDTLFGDGRFFSGDGGAEDGKEQGQSGGWSRWWGRGDRKDRGRNTMSTTRWLATKHGIQHKRRLCVFTIPLKNWKESYKPANPSNNVRYLVIC